MTATTITAATQAWSLNGKLYASWARAKLAQMHAETMMRIGRTPRHELPEPEQVAAPAGAEITPDDQPEPTIWALHDTSRWFETDHPRESGNETSEWTLARRWTFKVRPGTETRPAAPIVVESPCYLDEGGWVAPGLRPNVPWDPTTREEQLNAVLAFLPAEQHARARAIHAANSKP